MINEIALRKLSLLKFFYKHAIKHSQIDSKLDNMLAIHHFDLCNEFLLRILADEVKVNVDKLVTIENIFDYIHKNLKIQKSIEIGHKPEILRIRKLRNDVQHNAEFKSYDDVKMCFVHTKEFLENTIKLVFDLNFTEINLISLIEQDEIKKDMQKSFDLIQENKYLDAIEIINSALEKKLGKLKKEGYIPSAHSLLGFSSAWSQKHDIRVDDIRLSFFRTELREIEQLKEAIEKEHENVKRISEKILELVDAKFESYTQGIMYEIAIVGLGINYADYSRYKNILMHARFHKKLNESDINFCFDFVIELMIKPLTNMIPTSDVRYKQADISEFF